MTTIFLCPRCRAMLGTRLHQDEDGTFVCPTCRARIIPDRTCTYCPTRPVGDRGCLEVETFLREWSGAAELPQIDAHHEKLRNAVGIFGDWKDPTVGVDKLFDALAEAKGFVHFVSWGISYLMLGAMKLLSAQSVLVNGIVSGVRYADMLEEMNSWEVALESVFMNVVGIDQAESRQAPHLKLLVIDGLVAFKGSANLTTDGWRKASKHGEMVEVVTDPMEVQRLNNTYFTKAWTRWGRNRLLTVGDIIKMDHM